MRFGRDPAAVLVTALLLAQAGVFARLSRGRPDPHVPPLAQLAEGLAGWRVTRSDAPDSRTQRVLHPDDYFAAAYSREDGGPDLTAMVAYFSRQRTGHAPHSPRNCLPGSGWAIESSRSVRLPRTGASVNRSVIAKGAAKAVVLYWYQTAHHADASEYTAKLHLVADTLRYGRGDTALVRVAAPIVGDEIPAAERAAMRLAADLYRALRKHLNE